MPAAIIEVPTLSFIPKFVPFGVLYYTQDTGNIYVGTGSSSPPNVELVASGGTPGGFNGDIQYNNLGAFAGSAATIDAAGNIVAPSIGDGVDTLSFDGAGDATLETSSTISLIGGNSEVTIGNSIGITDPLGTVWNSATGGTQGAGTINAAGLFVQGVAVSTTPGTTLSGTGIARNTGACTELSGDVTTSGSNVSTVGRVNGGSIPTGKIVVGTNSSGQIIDVGSQTKNSVLAGPTSGSAAEPTFRQLSWPDMPTSGVNPGTGITFEQAASTAANPVPTAGQVVNIAINQGDCVVVVADIAVSYNADQAVQVGDDAGNPYGVPCITAAGSGVSVVFLCLNAPRAATLVRMIGGSGLTSLSVATYSGVQSAKTYTATNGSASTNATISLTTTVANSFMVAGINWFKSGTAVTIASGTGNLRTSIASSSTATQTGSAIIDNTQASLASLTCAGVLSTTPTGYGAVAIELIPA